MSFFVCVGDVWVLCVFFCGSKRDVGFVGCLNLKNGGLGFLVGNIDEYR